MKISYFEIQNFRKLKSCRVEIGEKNTLLVGANNSGKTSAIEALILFLKEGKSKEIATTDFTLSNWHTLNKIGDEWSQSEDVDLSQVAQMEELGGNEELKSLYLKGWRATLPAIDLWLDVDNSEIHYISHLIPSLSWEEGLIGVRLILEPKVNSRDQIEGLFRDYRQAFKAAESTVATAQSGGFTTLKLWPQSLKEFLDRKLHSYFTVNAYLLDPAKLETPDDGLAKPQELPDTAFPISQKKPFEGLFKIDVINAQRGFSDVHTSDSAGSSATPLSSQFRSYYDRHLDPSDLPEPADVEALSAIEEAKEKFDAKLKSGFQSAITELEDMGYPGFSDPEIIVTSNVNPVDGLAHDSAVQFRVGMAEQEQKPLLLPEKYNGLGYQNLISMVFRLIRYRDEWLRIGKAGKRRLEDEDTVIEPLHLVLIEEPEAHLHAQVQQVFIKNAHKVLRNSDDLDDKFTTQLIVSTHSSHIAHEVEFSDLRYFRRLAAKTKEEVPCATLVNLSETFGDKSNCSKFASRYLKTTHCDLFFADAVIMVEGPAERMLVPHFIKEYYKKLDSRYITVLEIGGSHAHRLRPLIEKLGILCLVITDLDSVVKPEGERAQKIRPERDKGYLSGNHTLKSWLPNKELLDDLLECTEKISTNGLVCVAYPAPISAVYSDGDDEVEGIPYTFEDALALSNIGLFRNISDSKGLLKKITESLTEETILAACCGMFDALDGPAKKAEMALELLYLHEPSELATPKYIAEGLMWLQTKLEAKDSDLIVESSTANGEQSDL